MQIRMDKENRELKAHGSYEFPVNISYEQLSRYERGSFSWHWHPEIELTFVLSGQIGYQVNGKSYVLKEGEGIFCASQRPDDRRDGLRLYFNHVRPALSLWFFKQCDPDALRRTGADGYAARLHRLFAGDRLAEPGTCLYAPHLRPLAFAAVRV